MTGAARMVVANRAQMVAEARSWVGTPYHMGAMVKGAGADCGSFLLGVLQACGLAEGEEVGLWKADWFCHTGQERYLRRMMRNAAKICEQISYPTLNARPGDLVLTRSSNSHVYNHAGIVLEWPRIIHAVEPAVSECDATAHQLWCFRQVAVFDPFGMGEKC
jgi:NlpC/P60 family putative phage cell wall peptidase